MKICDAFDGCEFPYGCRRAGRCIYLEEMDDRAAAEDEAERAATAQAEKEAKP